MKITATNTRETLLLFLGDFLIFLVSLWLTLALRHFSIPKPDVFLEHLIPFSLLFAVWVVVFFVAGLYDKHTVMFKKKLPETIFNAQLFNILLAALFFFFVPYFGIAPKTNLVIYLAVSFLLVVLWRLSIFPWSISHLTGGRRQNAILVGSGPEARELYEEVEENNSRYPIRFILHIDPQEIGDSLDIQAALIEYISSGEVSVIVGDSHGKEFEFLVPLLSNLAFLDAHFHFIDISTMYENIFDRVPTSLVRYNWFLENISTSPKYIYDVLKRAMDIVATLLLGAVPIVTLPFLYLAMKFEDGGPLFIYQERVGKDNKPIKIVKFRSMSGSDRGGQVLKTKLSVTKVGAFIRKTRLDEFPQLWNVLQGDLSLIGPRPEFPVLVKQYAERIPHYNVRHVIKPGLTGWAQIKHQEHPHHGIDIGATSDKLSYDLYYIKNRTFMLDIHIALKTAKTLISRVGR